MDENTLLEKLLNGEIKPGRKFVPERYKHLEESCEEFYEHDFKFDSTIESNKTNEEFARECEDKQACENEILASANQKDELLAEADQEDDKYEECVENIDIINELKSESKLIYDQDNYEINTNVEINTNIEINSLNNLFQYILEIGNDSTDFYYIYINIKYIVDELISGCLVLKGIQLKNEVAVNREISSKRQYFIGKNLDDILQKHKKEYDSLNEDMLNNFEYNPQIKYEGTINNYEIDKKIIEFNIEKHKMDIISSLIDDIENSNLINESAKYIYSERLKSKKKDRIIDGLTDKQLIRRKSIENRRATVQKWLENRESIKRIRKKKINYIKLTSAEKKIIKDGCITQKQLAEQLGVSLKTIELDIKHIKNLKTNKNPK